MKSNLLKIATLLLPVFSAAGQVISTSDFSDAKIRESLTGISAIAKDPLNPIEGDIWKTTSGTGSMFDEKGNPTLSFTMGNGSDPLTGIWRQDANGDIALCFSGPDRVVVPFLYQNPCVLLGEDMLLTNFGAHLYADNPDVLIDIALYEYNPGVPGGLGTNYWNFNGFDPAGWPTGTYFDADANGFQTAFPGGISSSTGFIVQYTGYNPKGGPVMFDVKNLSITHDCAVPEPNGVLMLLSGSAFALLYRRRNRQG